MKKTSLFVISILTILVITSFTINQAESQSKPIFNKIVFLDIDINQDSVLFKPYSKAWSPIWLWADSAIRYKGSAVLSYNSFKNYFHERTDNLWTIVFPNIIEGNYTTPQF